MRLLFENSAFWGFGFREPKLNNGEECIVVINKELLNNREEKHDRKIGYFFSSGEVEVEYGSYISDKVEEWLAKEKK